MSILSALKAKGAKGKNIEEAVKTLPLNGGGSDNSIVIANVEIDDSNNNAVTCDKTYDELLELYNSGKIIIASILVAGSYFRCFMAPSLQVPVICGYGLAGNAKSYSLNIGSSSMFTSFTTKLLEVSN